MHVELRDTDLATFYNLSLPSGRNYSIMVEAINAMGSSGNATAGGGTSVHTTLSVPAQCSPPFGVTRLLGLPTQTAILVAWHQPFDNGNPITSYRLVADGIPYLVNTLQANGVGQVDSVMARSRFGRRRVGLELKIGGNLRNIEFIKFVKFGFRGFGCAAHSG